MVPLLSEDAEPGSANTGHKSYQIIMVLTFRKVVEEERGGEATETVYGPQSLRHLKSRKCFPTPDGRHLAGRRSSAKSGRGIHESISS